MFSKSDTSFHKATFAKAKDYETVFTSAAGKRVLHDLMNSHYLGRAVFDKDPHMLAFKEGQRNVVLRILHILQQDSEILYRRLKEAQDEYRYNSSSQ